METNGNGNDTHGEPDPSFNLTPLIVKNHGRSFTNEELNDAIDNYWTGSCQIVPNWEDGTPETTAAELLDQAVEITRMWSTTAALLQEKISRTVEVTYTGYEWSAIAFDLNESMDPAKIGLEEALGEQLTECEPNDTYYTVTLTKSQAAELVRITG